MIYYVYIDLTLDGRPFYVGKGDDARVKKVKRNVLHTRIATKHGQVRRVVFETLNEIWAFEREIELIALLNTFVGCDQPFNAWGANLTRGGEGSSGWKPTFETRQRMSTNRLGKKPTYADPEARAKKISITLTGMKRPLASAALKGQAKSQEHKDKLRIAALNRPDSIAKRLRLSMWVPRTNHRCSVCHQIGHYSTTCSLQILESTSQSE